VNLDHYHRLAQPNSTPPLQFHPPRAVWRFTGPDRVRYVNGQVTNDVARLQPDQTCYAAVTTAKGRMEGEVFIRAMDDTLWLDAPLELRESLGLRLGKYLIADDAEMEDVTDEWTLVHILGGGELNVERSTLSVQRSDFARYGLVGTDFWVTAGQPHSLGEEVDPLVLETIRLELGWPRWGMELDANTLPPEAGLESRAISYDKGCYIGQETIARIKSIGHVNRSLCVLAALDDTTPTVETPLTASGQKVGHITSAGFSPLLQKGIALGWVGRHHAAPGTELEAGGQILTVIPPPRQFTL
jgi:folate-binding protein YgfZ